MTACTDVQQYALMSAPHQGRTAREGVWTGPHGLRAEVIHEGALWRTYMYLSRHAEPSVIEHENPEKLDEALAGLEAQGWRHAPGAVPSGPRTAAEAATRATAAQWDSANVIVAFVVVGAIVALLFWMLS